MLEEDYLFVQPLRQFLNLTAAKCLRKVDKG